MIDRAKHEIELYLKANAGSEGEHPYAALCCDSALKAYESLCNDGHSGMPVRITKNILNRLIDGKPLTPITSAPDEWCECAYTQRGCEKEYQSSRQSSLFKYVFTDGHEEYSDIDRVSTAYGDSRSLFYNGFVTRLIDKMFPITLPYMPPDRGFLVHCIEYGHNPVVGDYDLGVMYVRKPDGERVDINRFFNLTNETYKEIRKFSGEVQEAEEERKNE